MPKRGSRRQRKKTNAPKGFNQYPPGKRGGGISRRQPPTLVLKAHAQINQTLTGVNVKQVNIIPTLSVFGADILDEAKNF